MFNAALRALGFRSPPTPPDGQSESPSRRRGDAGVTNDWIEDLRRQVTRLEGQVDELQSEIHDQRGTHAEEMRRKDIMVQGAMQQIAHLTELAGLPPPSSEPKQIESKVAGGGSSDATLEAEVEPPAQRPVATPAQPRPATARPAADPTTAPTAEPLARARSGRRKSSENLSVPGWFTINVYEAARLPA